jgi:hypothetical protein
VKDAFHPLACSERNHQHDGPHQRVRGEDTAHEASRRRGRTRDAQRRKELEYRLPGAEPRQQHHEHENGAQEAQDAVVVLA